LPVKPDRDLLLHYIAYFTCMIGVLFALYAGYQLLRPPTSSHRNGIFFVSSPYVGGGFFLGVLFIVSARRMRRRSTKKLEPPTRDEVDRRVARQMEEDSQRNSDNLSLFPGAGGTLKLTALPPFGGDGL
jgi:hypothetical protein